MPLLHLYLNRVMQRHFSPNLVLLSQLLISTLSSDSKSSTPKRTPSGSSSRISLTSQAELHPGTLSPVLALMSPLRQQWISHYFDVEQCWKTLSEKRSSLFFFFFCVRTSKPDRSYPYHIITNEFALPSSKHMTNRNMYFNLDI